MEDKIKDEKRELYWRSYYYSPGYRRVRKAKAKIAEEIEAMKGEIERLEELIQRETLNYEEKLNTLEEFLVIYQRMGPSSFIDIILSADSITNLLDRINILRDLAKNSGELLKSIEEIRDRLVGKS